MKHMRSWIFLQYFETCTVYIPVFFVPALCGTLLLLWVAYMCVLVRAHKTQTKQGPAHKKLLHSTTNGKKLHRVPLIWRSTSANNTTGVRQKLSTSSTVASLVTLIIPSYHSLLLLGKNATHSTFSVSTGQWSTFLGQRLSVSCSVVSVSSGSCREAMWEQFLTWCQDIWGAG